jgi:class 3 adenylate cyclase
MGDTRDFGSDAKDTARQSMPRPLTAVVVGDVSDDIVAAPLGEEETRYRMEHELIEPVIRQHRGTLGKAGADGFVATFDNPGEAARCGVIVQERIVERNQSFKHPPVEYRVGVNLGDVIVDPDDIYGDGVYLASGLAAIAGPGQVCISEAVYEQVRHKLYYSYEPLGDRKVSGIAGPVSCYRVHSGPDAVHATRRTREIILIFLLCLAGLIITGGIWWLSEQPHQKFAGAEAQFQAETAQRDVRTEELAGHSASFKGRSADFARLGN